MNQQKTPDQLLKEVAELVNRIRTYTPRVGVYGNSGVGKSSLCNMLFGREVAKTNDVEACTRTPQEILIGGEGGGMTLVDLPGIGEDPDRQIEYTQLYKSELPTLDLVLWAIKADDRNYASAIDAYKEVFASCENGPPVVFVITQTDKTNDTEDWDHQNYRPSGSQIGNIAIKENDVSRRFGVSAKNIISIAVSKKGHSYNLKELVELVVSALPKEKKFAFTREAKGDYVSDEARISAEAGIWDSIKEVAGDALSSIKDAAIKIVEASAPKIVLAVIATVGGLFKRWF